MEHELLCKLSLYLQISSSACWHKLIQKFSSAENVYNTQETELHPFIPTNKYRIKSILSGPNTKLVHSQIEQAKKLGVKITHFFDSNYPVSLKTLKNPPAFLFYRGNLHFQPGVAIVGTRKPSHYGIRVSTHLSQELTRHSINVVSGMAVGIDQHAHLGATNNHGGIAILGCGLDSFFYNGVGKLHQQLWEKGTIISEYPIGFKGTLYSFPQRNRIISGLSKATVVIEAGKKSGALITANYAIQQNKTLFAIPGSIFETNSHGTHQLIIQKKATLLCQTEQLLSLFNFKLTPLSLSKPAPPPSLNVCEQAIYNQLQQPQSIQSIQQQSSNYSFSQLLNTLTQLECQNLVRRNPGGVYYRI